MSSHSLSLNISLITVIIRDIWLINNYWNWKSICFWACNLWHQLFMILNVVTDISRWNKRMLIQDVLCSLLTFFTSILYILYIFIDFLTSNHWNRNDKVTQQAILSSSLKCLLTLRLSLHHLHALIDGTQHNGFKWCYLKAFIVVYLIQNIKSNDALHFG